MNLVDPKQKGSARDDDGEWGKDDGEQPVSPKTGTAGSRKPKPRPAPDGPAEKAPETVDEP